MVNNILKKIIIYTAISFSMIFCIIPNISIPIYAVETDRSYRYSIGDVAEDDDMIKSNDMLILKKYLLGMCTFTPSQRKTADINMNGSINSNDLLFMNKCLLGESSYNDNAIDKLHVAISNSENIILQNMRDVIGQYMYQYIYNGYKYNQNVSRTYTINGETFTGCRTDCSTAVTLALYMSGVLNKTKVENTIGKAYLTTNQMVNRFSEIEKCVNDGYSIELIEITPNVTFIQPGDILVYPNGHTSVVVSTSTTGLPNSLYSNNSDVVAVYGAGGDFATVHSYRLKPEIETIDQSSNGKSQGIRPYKYIIRVNIV